jgi:acetyl-CoA/propionyl-CoA carboxylase biotin carboxyl carrier protein
MDFTYEYNGEERTVSLDKTTNGWNVRYDGTEFGLTSETLGPGRFSIMMGPKPHRVFVAEGNGETYVFVAGRQFVFREPGTAGARRGTAGAAVVDGILSIAAPMPGEVVKITVEEGQKVAAGQVVAIVEAMKMEHELATTVDGVVNAVHVGTGDQVDNAQVLVDIEAAGQ